MTFDHTDREDIEDHRLSLFNIYFDLDEGSSVGVYNTLHDSAIVLDRETYVRVIKEDSDVENDILSSLFRNRIIFPKNFDERQYFRYYINKLKYSPKHASFVFCLTSDCNLTCPYCFEGQNKIPKYMSPKLARSAVTFLSKMYQKNSSLTDIYITFFGGEPLLNREVMGTVCEEISRIHEIRDKVKYILTSNLTSLTNTDLTLIKQYPFISVQVAMDGSKRVHDSRRKFKSGRGSFDLIVKNIKKLVENHLPVTIFLNFDRETEECYDEFLLYIKSNLPYEQINFVLNPLTKSLCNRSCDIYFIDKGQKEGMFLNIYQKFKNHGITIDAFGQKDMVCMLTTDISCIIDPEGWLYKCCLMLGLPKYRIGNIFIDHYYDLNYKMITAEPWESCLEAGCAYLPICGGGCRCVALMETGDMKALDCRKKDYYDEGFRVILRDHFNQLMEGAEI